MQVVFLFFFFFLKTFNFAYIHNRRGKNNNFFPLKNLTENQYTESHPYNHATSYCVITIYYKQFFKQYTTVVLRFLLIIP